MSARSDGPGSVALISGDGPVPAVIYAARSQAEEEGKDSTGDQVGLVRQRVEREPGRFVYGEPHADHASGYRRSRGPELEAAIRAAERAVSEYGRAELWVWITSRLGRGTGRLGEARAVGKLLYELRAMGVTCRSVEDDEFATNEMLWGFASRMASKYSEDLAANVKRGIASSVRGGKPWGEPGYGYAKADDGHWRVESSEAATARVVFERYVGSEPSYSGVARWLNAQGYRPRRGKRWTPMVVRKLLTSRHVLGEFHHGGEWHDGKHKAIIDAETWRTAQLLAEGGRKFAPRSRGGRLPARHVFIRGMLRCGVCGAAMLPRSDTDSYVCRTRKQTGGASACPMPVLRREAVEAPALRLFERWALDVDGTRKRIADQLDGAASATRAQARRAAREVAEKQAALERFDRDYASGTLSAENYARLTAGFGEELAGAEAELARLSAQAERADGVMASLDAEHEALRRLAELRSSIASRVGSAAERSALVGDVGALRAATQAVFSAVYVMPAARLMQGPPPEGVNVAMHAVIPPDGKREALHVVPAVRPELIADPSNVARDSTFLRRVAVAFGMDADELAHNRTGIGVPE